MNSQTIVKVSAEQGNDLCCPPIDTPVWNLHPRVYLAFNDSDTVECPYCGTLYELEP